MILRIRNDDIGLPILGLSLLWLAIARSIGEQGLSTLLFKLDCVKLIQFEAEEDKEEYEDTGTEDSDIPYKR